MTFDFAAGVASEEKIRKSPWLRLIWTRVRPRSSCHLTLYSRTPAVAICSVLSVSYARISTGVLQFNTPNDCHKAYSECQEGKQLGGHMLYAEFGEGSEQDQLQSQPYHQESSYGQRQSQGGSHQSNNQSHISRPQEALAPRGRTEDYRKVTDEAILTVSNLPYSATERDIRKEFPDTCNIKLNFDDRGRFSGVAQLSFRSRDQCEAALQACSGKAIQGRNLRGRIGPGQARHDSGNYQRNYDNRSGYQSSNYNSNRRDFDSGRRFRGGGGGGGGGDRDWRDSRGSRDGSKDFNRGGRSDRFGSRRERSPGQNEPVRGYAASKGFRITSAVIQGNESPSSNSSSGED